MSMHKIKLVTKEKGNQAQLNILQQSMQGVLPFLQRKITTVNLKMQQKMQDKLKEI